MFPSVADAARRRERLERACEVQGREPLTYSMMTGCLLGDDEGQVRDRGRRLMELTGQQGELDPWLEGLRAAWVIGTPEQAAERLAEYEQAGVERVMLQHQLHDDVDMVALMGRLT